MRDVLRHPWRFFGFRHEVRLATHLKGSGYPVEPLFFDPSSEKGGPDLIVHDRDRAYAIQCKATNPSNSADLSYDLFQFLGGSWARLVQDTARSLFLSLNVKKRLDEDSVKRLITQVGRLVTHDLMVAGHLETNGWDVQVSEIGYGPGKVTPDGLKRAILTDEREPLYSELEEIKPRSAVWPFPQVAGCHITGRRRGGLERQVFSAASHAANEYRGQRPLIVSVNLYQETDMFEYLNGPRVAPLWLSWQDSFFRDYPKVAMLLVSSNCDRYSQVGPVSFALATKYLVVESPRWEGVLPAMGLQQ